MSGGLRRELGSSAAGVVAARLLGALGGVLSARILGPSDKGRLALFLLVATIGGSVVTGGLQFWIAREVARLGDGVRSVIRRHVALTTMAIVLATCGAIAVMGTDSPRAFETAAAACFVEAWLVSMLALAVANGARRLELVALATGGGSLLYVVAIVVLDLLHQATVGTILLSAALANAVAIPVVSSCVRALPRTSGPGRYLVALRTGVPGAFSELLSFATMRVDVGLVALFLDARHVGWYAVASSLAEVVLVVPDAVAQVVLPRVAAVMTDRLAEATRLAVAAMVTAAVFMAIAATPLVRILFGVEYLPAVSAFRWLLPGVVALGIWKIFAADLAGRGLTIWRAVSALGGLAVLGASDVVLLASGGGLRAAALSSTVAYVVAAAVALQVWRRRSTGSLREALQPRWRDIGFLAEARAGVGTIE
jgi:O-antigen/teichoic acid export membrane protein